MTSLIQKFEQQLAVNMKHAAALIEMQHVKVPASQTFQSPVNQQGIVAMQVQPVAGALSAASAQQSQHAEVRPSLSQQQPCSGESISAD